MLCYRTNFAPLSLQWSANGEIWITFIASNKPQGRGVNGKKIIKIFSIVVLTNLPLSENHLLNKEWALTSTNWLCGYLMVEQINREKRLNCQQIVH